MTSNRVVFLDRGEAVKTTVATVGEGGGQDGEGVVKLTNQTGLPLRVACGLEEGVLVMSVSHPAAELNGHARDEDEDDGEDDGEDEHAAYLAARVVRAAREYVARVRGAVADEGVMPVGRTVLALIEAVAAYEGGA